MSKNKDKAENAFIDADGSVNIEAVASMINDLPAAVQKLDLAELKKVMPTLQKIVNGSGEGEEMAEEPMDQEGESITDMGGEEEMKDEEKEKVSVTDSVAFKVALQDAKKELEAKKNAEIKAHLSAINHATKFVDSSYSFTDKSTTQIMRDAVATQFDAEQFTDSELSTVFKMLKPQESKYKSFGDSGTSKKWAEAGEKEI
jgi:hypothetical protein